MPTLDADQAGRGVRIHPVADPAAGVWVESPAQGETLRSLAQVRQYAGGKRRAVGYRATEGSASVQINLTDADDMAALKSWVGQTVVMRTLRGEVVAGLLSDWGRDTPAPDPTGLLSGSVRLTTTTDDGTV